MGTTLRSSLSKHELRMRRRNETLWRSVLLVTGSDGRGLHALLKGVLRQQLSRVRVQHRGPRRRSRKTGPLVSLSTPQKTSIVKHVLGHGVERPVVALSRISGLPRDFDETVIEREIVTDRVLPGRKFFSVVRKSVSNEIANSAESQSLVGRLQNGHGDQGDVGVGRLDHTFATCTRFLRPVAVRIFLSFHQAFFFHQVSVVHHLVVVRIADVFHLISGQHVVRV